MQSFWYAAKYSGRQWCGTVSSKWDSFTKPSSNGQNTTKFTCFFPWAKVMQYIDIL